MKEDYEKLCEMIWYMSGCITRDFVSVYQNISKEKKSLYSLSWEAFKTVEFINVGLLQVVAPSQCFLLFRSLTELVATVKILFEHSELIPVFNEHNKIKLENINKSNKEKRELVMEKFVVPFKSAMTYLDYGWVSSLLDQGEEDDLGINTILKLAKFEDFNLWRDICNKFMHGGLNITSFEADALDELCSEVGYMTAALFQELACVYHNDCGFDFNFEKLKFDEFKALFERITAERIEEIKNKRVV